MRFTRPKQIKPPKKARAIRYKPRGDQKLWKCWNCGFICNEERDDHSGTTAGVTYTDYQAPAFGGSGLDGMLIQDVPGEEHVLMKLAQDGTNKAIEHVYLAEVANGCPLCGTTNYKG